MDIVSVSNTRISKMSRNTGTVLLLWIFTTCLLQTSVLGFIEPIPCDEYISGDSGIIASPNYPFNYSSGRSCLQRISFQGFTSLNQKQICFTFRMFQLAFSSDCFDDYLEFPSLSNANNGLIRYCGFGIVNQANQAQSNRSSVFAPNFCWPLESGRPFDLRFRSMVTSSYQGYYADYEIIPLSDPTPVPSAVCTKLEFRCFNDDCIPRRLACDGKADCADSSDEGFWHARCPVNGSIEACSFEDDMCKFAGHGVVWNNTSPAGPRYDNTFLTFATGNFVYFVGEGASYLNYTATPIDRAEDQCLSFWFFMSGYVGTLSVFVTDSAGQRSAVWFRKDNQGMRWQQAEIDIPLASFPLQEVSFECSEGAMDTNNIAIDDISLLQGNCFRSDPSCTFELGLCGWRPPFAQMNSLLWSRTYDASLTSEIDPMSTEQNNFYKLTLDWANCAEGSVARLISRAAKTTLSGPFCLRFWYLIPERSYGVLNVSVVNSVKSSQTVWSSEKIKPSRFWTEAVTSFNINMGPFQIVLDGICKVARSSYIAVDNIALAAGYCTSSPPGRTAPPIFDFSTFHPSGCQWDQYKCASSAQCIYRKFICDGRVDCADKSDEINCPNTGGELSQDDHTLVANDVIIGVSVVCVGIFLTVVISIVVAVRRRSILLRMARIRALRRHATSVVDYPDPFPMFSEPKPPPYDFSLPVAPSYAAHPPPYYASDGDQTDDGAPPAYNPQSVETRERRSAVDRDSNDPDHPSAVNLVGAMPPSGAGGLRGFRTSSV